MRCRKVKSSLKRMFLCAWKGVIRNLEYMKLLSWVCCRSLASSCGWATAAHECRQAAGEKPFLCFGARHVHPAVAPVMERAAVVGGASGASCILGARLAGIEPSGTVPHSVFLIVGDTVDVAKNISRHYAGRRGQGSCWWILSGMRRKRLCGWLMRWQAFRGYSLGYPQ